MNRLCWRVGLMAALLGGSAAAQTAQDVERAKKSFKAGATAYAAGEYLAAIQALETAYELTPRPAIAFSLAQAERRQYFVAKERRHLERAIELFRRYLAQVPSGGRRADALDALSQLEPLAATFAATAPPSSPEQKISEAQPARRTRLMITCEAPGARLALDGGRKAASPLIREVQPGRHRVDVEAPGFYPARQEVTAVAGELIPVTVSLREQPSTLSVSLARDAELYVDGTFVGQGDRRTLSLPSGPHRLSATKKGYRVTSTVIELERGKTRSVRLVLERTPQRTAAYGLLIGGGAGLGTGLVLGALAIRAENRAEDFLAEKAHGNVTRSQLAGYREAVDERNRYRIATIATMASAGGLLATGVFLYLLDSPNQADLRKALLPPAPPTRDLSSRIRLQPLVSADANGAAISGAF